MIEIEQYLRSVLEPTNIHDARYELQSFSSTKDDTYIVSHNKYTKKYECSCPHWIFRLRKSGTNCKHINALKQFLDETAWMLEDLK